jgi:hypothetical protein
VKIVANSYFIEARTALHELPDDKSWHSQEDSHQIYMQSKLTSVQDDSR